MLHFLDLVRKGEILRRVKMLQLVHLIQYIKVLNILAKYLNPRRYPLPYHTLSPSDLDKLKIVADDEKKITHDKKWKIFTLKGIKSLDIRFPSSGNYIFKNITKKNSSV